MAAPSFMIGGDDESAPPSDDAGMPPMAPEGDARTAAAKALMSALKSNDPAKFADAFEEMMNNIDSMEEPDGDEMAPPMDEAAPPPEDMGF